MKNKNVIANLQNPTPKLVNDYLEKHENDNRFKNEGKIQKRIINTIFNNEYDTILLTVVVINQLYRTNIYEVYKIADHIHRHREDIYSMIKKGDDNAVSKVATGHGIISSKNGKEFNFYSFATKYCSYLEPDKFPIYDSYIERMLYMYNKKEMFSDFGIDELRDYGKFRVVIEKFIEHYDLKEFNLKQIDIFLWMYGKELFPN